MKVSKEKSRKDIKSLIIIASKKYLSRIHHGKNITISYYFRGFPKPSLLICSDGFGTVATFGTNQKGKSPPVGMARLLPKKIKRELVIREGSFGILIVSSRGQLRPLCYFFRCKYLCIFQHCRKMIYFFCLLDRHKDQVLYFYI